MTNPDLAALSAATCTLDECPPGLFWFGDTLGFKSEYTSTLENPRRYQCDAYVVESGEYFHGGAHSTKERAALIVRPVGNLVQIDREGMRERVAKAMCRADPEVRMGDADGVVEQRVQHEWKHYLDAADVAIAAMMGEKP